MGIGDVGSRRTAGAGVPSAEAPSLSFEGLPFFGGLVGAEKNHDETGGD